MSARLWFLLYQALTWMLMLPALLLLPILRLVQPKFAKWFLMRFRPRPLTRQPQIWIHAVSMGEIKIARALADQWPLPLRDHILFTTATQSGYHLLIDEIGRERVRYLPWDLTLCYQRLFGAFKVPDLVVVETEIWPTLFSWVHKNGARLVLVNGRLSLKTLRLRKNTLFRGAMARVIGFAVRNTIDRDRFLQFGVAPERLAITGNIKFDFKPLALPAGPLVQWLSSGPLVIFASISTDEVPLLVPQAATLLAEQPGLRILWAPRHLRDMAIHKEALAFLQPVLRSNLSDAEPTLASLMILDSFGELAGCYGHACLSLIGGTFNQRGGQNFLESLQAGTPAVMGPSYENFRREVAEAREEDTVICLMDASEVAPQIKALVADPDHLDDMSGRAHAYLARHAGAIIRTNDFLADLGMIPNLETR